MTLLRLAGAVLAMFVSAPAWCQQGQPDANPENHLPQGAPRPMGINLGPDDRPAFLPPPDGFDKPRTDVPHGTLTPVTYFSSTVGVDRTMVVYTPPGYSKDHKYPVLFLLHGIAGNQWEWTGYVHADVILDNLYAEGKLVPMIVVFPNGRAEKDDRPPAEPFLHAAAFENFEGDLLKDLLPFLESHYPIDKRREGHALAGLSMGGGQSLNFGLRHLDTFAWIGAFSGAPNMRNAQALIPEPKDTAKRLKLLWLSCGNQDGLIRNSQALHQYLKKEGVPHIWHVGPGGHDAPAWREALYLFAPLLFR